MDPQEDTTRPNLFEQAAQMETDGAPPLPEIKLDPSQFDIDLSDHNPEAQAIRTEDEKDGVAAPQELPFPHTNIQRPAALVDPVGKLKNEIDPFVDDFEIGKVEVTMTERDQFVRSALHDTEMSFDIMLEGPDISVKVAIPTESFTTLVAQVIDQWDSQGIVKSTNNVSWLLLFQQLHAWYQIREFGGKPTPWAKFFDDGVPRLSQIRAAIENYDSIEQVVNMSAPRWRLMVNAMALAEYKYKLCLDAWRTRAFFVKADTA